MLLLLFLFLLLMSRWGWKWQNNTFQPLDLENRDVCTTAFPTIPPSQHQHHTTLWKWAVFSSTVSCWPRAFKRLRVHDFPKWNWVLGTKMPTTVSLRKQSLDGLMGHWNKAVEENYGKQRRKVTRQLVNYDQLRNILIKLIFIIYFHTYPVIAQTNFFFVFLERQFSNWPKIGIFWQKSGDRVNARKIGRLPGKSGELECLQNLGTCLRTWYA